MNETKWPHNFDVNLYFLAARVSSGSLWVRKFGYIHIKEILVLTKSSVRTSNSQFQNRPTLVHTLSELNSSQIPRVSPGGGAGVVVLLLTGRVHFQTLDHVTSCGAHKFFGVQKSVENEIRSVWCRSRITFKPNFVHVSRLIPKPLLRASKIRAIKIMN